VGVLSLRNGCEFHDNCDTCPFSRCSLEFNDARSFRAYLRDQTIYKLSINGSTIEEIASNVNLAPKYVSERLQRYIQGIKLVDRG